MDKFNLTPTASMRGIEFHTWFDQQIKKYSSQGEGGTLDGAIPLYLFFN